MHWASRVKPCTRSMQVESEMAMHRRFSPEARTLIIAATNAAALLEAEQTEAEHFLIALLVGPASKAQDYLRGHGLTHDDVEQALTDTQDVDLTFDDDDAAALATLGFDLPRILGQLEDRFGPTPASPRSKRGPRRLRVGFGDSAKHMLSQALLEASFRDEAVAPEHILLGLLRDPSPACVELMRAYALSYDDACGSMFPPPQSNAS